MNNALWMFEKLKNKDEHVLTKALVKISDSSAMASQPVIDPREYFHLLQQISDQVVDVDDERQVDSAFGALVAG